MLKFLENGTAYFVSKTGRAYEVLEGMTIGKADRFASDMCIIFYTNLTEEEYIKTNTCELGDIDWDIVPQNEYVNFCMGSNFILAEDGDTAKYIDEYIEEYEQKRGWVKSINLDQLGSMMGIPVTHM